MQFKVYLERKCHKSTHLVQCRVQTKRLMSHFLPESWDQVRCTALVTWPGAPVSCDRCCCHVLSRESGKWHLVNVGTCVGTTETWLEDLYDVDMEKCGIFSNHTNLKPRITPRHH